MVKGSGDRQYSIITPKSQQLNLSSQFYDGPIMTKVVYLGKFLPQRSAGFHSLFPIKKIHKGLICVRAE